MKRYFLVRHGETDLNVSGVFYGHTDCGLNELGKSQARQVGEYLSKIEFHKVYSSPLIRAKDTKDIILAENENGHEFGDVLDERLMELGFGLWENKSMAEIKLMDEDFWGGYFNGWPDIAAPGGESFRDFFDRVESFFLDVMKSDDAGLNLNEGIHNLNEGIHNLDETAHNHEKTGLDKIENILIVGHQGSIGLLPVFAMGLTMKDYWKFRIEQGTYSVIMEDQRKFHLEKINAAGKY